MIKNNAFGEFFKEVRLRQNKSLRQFCFDNGFDPGQISRIERGLCPPPLEISLKKYAIALKLIENSEEWIKFFNLSDENRDRIHLPQTEEELCRKLPLFIRSATGKKLTEEQLKNLIESIKNC